LGAVPGGDRQRNVDDPFRHGDDSPCGRSDGAVRP
jgi:hypothetical protein